MRKILILSISLVLVFCPQRILSVYSTYPYTQSHGPVNRYHSQVNPNKFQGVYAPFIVNNGSFRPPTHVLPVPAPLKPKRHVKKNKNKKKNMKKKGRCNGKGRRKGHVKRRGKDRGKGHKKGHVKTQGKGHGRNNGKGHGKRKRKRSRSKNMKKRKGLRKGLRRRFNHGHHHGYWPGYVHSHPNRGPHHHGSFGYYPRPVPGIVRCGTPIPNVHVKKNQYPSRPPLRRNTAPLLIGQSKEASEGESEERQDQGGEPREEESGNDYEEEEGQEPASQQP
jgi:hypothetical protein